MERWALITILLCSYGCIKEIRPSESFLTEYLEGPWINLTDSQVTGEVYPVWTYTYMGATLLVFLVTDLVRYKPIIILGSISYITCWSLLLWTKGVLAMQFMQFVYGIGTASEIAYYTYIYSMVSGETYQKVTSYTRAAFLVGRFFTGVSSQILISTSLMNYRQLNYISLVSVTISFIIAVCLPSAPSSIYFHKTSATSEEEVTANKKYTKMKIVIKTMMTELKNSYANKHILKWSIWWALATCGYFQVGNYIQNLWEEVLPSKTSFNENQVHIYNGAVEATSTILGAIAVYLVSFFSLNLFLFGNAILGLVTIIDAIFLIFMSWIENIWICYVGYMFVRISYQALITIISYQIAKIIPKDSHGLIFGFNTFMGLVLQSILTAIVVGKSGLHFGPILQFFSYAIYYITFGVAYFIYGSIYVIINRRSSTSDDSLIAESLF
ncbi:thiamine transporter 1-like [Centruroides sculpturatus]|uniref:thiamine transporter 1-like n=1 Tax=Centruroides sculpturatus TaxID=218467 RepID=UPI000C6E51D9|nr:thiamine transporter 1-like [Centruroides sculpturatus]